MIAEAPTLAEQAEQPVTDETLALHRVAAHLQLLLAVRRQARSDAHLERFCTSTKVA